MILSSGVVYILRGHTNRGVHVSFMNGNIYDSFGHL